MTTYWQLFKDCIDNLPASPESTEYTKQLTTANTLIDIGLGIEKLGITEIKEVVNKLHEKAKLFGHHVLFNANGKDYTFYLPKINNIESLIFAIIYYQHLKNYNNVSYQGSITWFRQIVINGVNEKKVTTKFQAMALLTEIKNYCKSQKITLDESQLLRKSNETAKDYIIRVTELFHITSDDAIDSNQTSESIIADETVNLESSLLELKKKKNALDTKIDSFSKKLIELHQATQRYLSFNNEWRNTSRIMQLYYWVLSWFHQIPLIQNLKEANEQCVKAEQALNEEIALYESVETYHIELKRQQQETIMEHEHIQEKLSQIKLEQSILQYKQQLQQQQEELKGENTSAVVQTCSEDETTSLEVNENVDTSVSVSEFSYYNFFKENLPSRQTMQAAAVAALAIVTQQLVTP